MRISCSNMKHLNFIALLLIFGFFISATQSAIAFTATPSSEIINTVVQYDWVITGLTPNILTIKLIFPSSVTLNATSPTIVQSLNGSTYDGSFSSTGTTITITLTTTDQLNTSLSFRTTNIKNPFRNSKIGESISVQQSTTIVTNSIQYIDGAITNCKLSFDGYTDQAVSTAYLDFKITNPINANAVVFSIYYGNSSGTYTQTAFKIINNGNVTCSYLYANGSYSNQIVATYSSYTPTFYCQFNNLNLAANSIVKLRLKNVRNPPYKSNYLQQTFIIQTGQSQIISYDISSSCIPTDVQLLQYQSTLSVTNLPINSNYNNPTVLTVQTIQKAFRSNDIILIDYTGLNFTQLGTSIQFLRPNSQSLQFTVNSNTTSQIITQYLSGVLPIQQNNKIQINLTNFVLQVPPSATPVNITFRFIRISGAISLEYLNIYATINAVPFNFASTDLIILPSDLAVGARTSYKFRITITQKLSTSAFFLINLPLQVNIGLFTSSSVCLFQSVATNVQSLCSVYDSINKIMRVDVNSSSGFSAQQLNITIGDLINPINPQRSYLFGANSYYNQSQITSQVQLGAGITPYTYTYRIMSVTTSNTQYTVNQYPAILTINYYPGVNIPSNLILIFNFTNNLTNLNYQNVSVGGSPTVYNMNNNVSTNWQIFNLTVSSPISALAAVIFNFQFRAPTSVANYQAVTITAISSTGVIYQKMSTYLNITVLYPASLVFSLTPSSLTTSVTTNYTLSFYTNVFHPSIFYLTIAFPSEITYNTGTTTCSAPCNSITDISAIPGVAPQKILLNITKNTTSNTYSIILPNIKNPRKIGTSSAFNLQTWTNATNGNMILNGSTTVTISYPNVANANFDATKSYYKMNVLPVYINVISLTNSLRANDFIRVRFDYRTYSLASTGSNGVVCANGYDCNHDITQSTSFTTVIIVKPTSSAARTVPFGFAIGGLNSSANTFINQQFPVTLQTYSNDTNGEAQMDEGNFMYSLSCRSTAALINKTCQTCNQTSQTCFTCYTGYYLYQGGCVTDCAISSTYRAVANSTDCIPCQNNCGNCISLTQCLTCISVPAGQPPFYLFQDATCQTPCNTAAGYYIANSASGIMCLRCWSPSCLVCTNGGSNSCLDCKRGSFKSDGRCIDSCDLSTNYVNNSTGECIPCNVRCNGCTGGLFTQCIACRPGYYNVSGACATQCPTGQVGLMNNTCGCQGACSTCSQFSTNCLTCSNTSLLLYNYQCIADCPDSSYRDSSNCIDCKQGCRRCTRTSCLECLPNYNIYENNCYTQCNNIEDRFSAVNGSCVQCPQGCDLCDSQLRCSICLANYTLVNSTICQKTCEIQKNCQVPNPVPDKILPIPGVITVAVWLAIIIVLKIFFINKIYMPYTYIFVGCIVELVQTIAIIVKMNQAIKTLIIAMTSRLLQSVSTTQTDGPKLYQYAIIGILAAVLAFNYLSNFVYLFLFCKYLRKYIPDRQIDKISNYLVLVLGTLTNYRFSLVAYSKLFPKPNITVQNQSKLTPIHYMCIVSLITSFLPLTAAGILIYNEYPLTDLFMLGVDLLIIEIFSLIFTIWMISVDKPSQYFEITKKYSKQQINNTVQAFNQKQRLNQSKHKMGMNNFSNADNSIIQVQDVNDDILIEQNNIDQVKPKQMKSDNQNQPLPKIPIRTSQININTSKLNVKPNSNNVQILSQSGKSKQQQIQPQKNNNKKLQQSISDKKTQRNKANTNDIQKNKKQDNKIANQHQHQNPHHQQQRGIQKRKRQLPKNFSKQKNTTQNKNKKEQLQIKMNNVNMSKNSERNDQSEQIDESLELQNLSMEKARSDIIKGQKKVLKPQTQRSSGILPVTMKKKQSVGMFDSEKASSQIDQIDFESLIQTKMIDKTKEKHKTIPVSKLDQQQHQQISPSWFNQQNQRYDFEESSDN